MSSQDPVVTLIEFRDALAAYMTRIGKEMRELLVAYNLWRGSQYSAWRRKPARSRRRKYRARRST